MYVIKNRKHQINCYNEFLTNIGTDENNKPYISWSSNEDFAIRFETFEEAIYMATYLNKFIKEVDVYVIIYELINYIIKNIENDLLVNWYRIDSTQISCFYTKDINMAQIFTNCENQAGNVLNVLNNNFKGNFILEEYNMR